MNEIENKLAEEFCVTHSEALKKYFIQEIKERWLTQTGDILQFNSHVKIRMKELDDQADRIKELEANEDAANNHNCEMMTEVDRYRSALEEEKAYCLSFKCHKNHHDVFECSFCRSNESRLERINKALTGGEVKS